MPGIEIRQRGVVGKASTILRDGRRSDVEPEECQTRLREQVLDAGQIEAVFAYMKQQVSAFAGAVEVPVGQKRREVRRPIGKRLASAPDIGCAGGVSVRGNEFTCRDHVVARAFAI